MEESSYSVTYGTILDLPAGTKVNHEKPQSEQADARLKFAIGSSQI
jgi:hypothetical protein